MPFHRGTLALILAAGKGGTLRRLHPRGMRLPLQTVVAYLKQVASALQKEGNDMQPIGEPEPHHRLLHTKLKGSAAPTYLTALSVIQGVALADFGEQSGPVVR